jgi:homoserine O-succinyltransferase
MVRDSVTGDLFVFNHLEYDATTLGDEYQRDVAAGLKTALPENYYPN